MLKTMSKCNRPPKKARYVYVDVYDGKQICRRAFTKEDVAQDGCTVICKAEDCYKIGHHRCAACELESYCSEACRLKDRGRHEVDCQQNTSPARRLKMKNFNRQSPCCGLHECPNPVVSLCRHCELTVCSKWECSKEHLNVCEAYLDAIVQREWVFIEFVRVGHFDDEKPIKSTRDVKQDDDGDEDDHDDWMLVSHKRGTCW